MKKCFNAYLMVEFMQKTDLPRSIDVYSESEDEITMLGNNYVRIASMKWEICCDEKGVTGFDIIAKTLEIQFEKGLYDDCSFFYKGKKWTVQECKDICSKIMR